MKREVLSATWKPWVRHGLAWAIVISSLAALAMSVLSLVVHVTRSERAERTIKAIDWSAVTLGDSSGDSSKLLTPQLYVVDEPLGDARADTLTIGNGGSTVLFRGAINYAKIQAPNTFRDGSKCYSLNVLHVDGTRVPVECP